LSHGRRASDCRPRRLTCFGVSPTSWRPNSSCCGSGRSICACRKMPKRWAPACFYWAFSPAAASAASTAATSRWASRRQTSGCQRLHLFGEAAVKRVLGHLQIVTRLDIDPEFRLHAEEAAEPQRRVGADGAAAQHDLVDAARRHTDRLGEPVLRDLHRFEEILQENFAGVNGL